jgi:3-hydroxybutyryl-CoA dehydrogenase
MKPDPYRKGSTVINVTHIGVVGAGTMGTGIAEVAAVAGLRVTLSDSAPAQIQSARDRIGTSLEKAERRGKLRDQAKAVLDRIRYTASLSDIQPCDFVVEAIVENTQLKQELHAALGRLTRAETVLASNTSSISITRLGQASGRPDRFVGMHFFNPVPIMPLVEVVRSPATTEATLAITEELARRMGKTPVRANDAPGFVANRVLMPMINEAVYALADGVADAKSIDQIMVLGCNHPMGPLALADLIGLDVCLFILEVLQRDTGDAKFRPCPLLRELVNAGKLGRKSGQGFYEYPT